MKTCEEKIKSIEVWRRDVDVDI